MLVDLSKELAKARGHLVYWCSQTNPNERFRDQMTIMWIDLNRVAFRIKQTRDTKERRGLISGFITRRNAFYRGIELLRQSKTKRERSRDRFCPTMP